MFAGKKSAQIREILINESAWEEMTCLFAPSLTPPGIIPEVGLFHAFLLPQTNIKAILDLVRDLFFLIARDVLNENIHATLFNKT